MNKIHCSVPILTLNAEKYLARCLESVRDFEDVYLVDGNSTDRTHEIARFYGVPVYKQVETDEPNVRITDFVRVRRRAYSFAKTDWILDLDSDEYLAPGLVEEIRGVLIREGNSPSTAYVIENKLQIGDKRVEFAFFYPSVLVRLYHKMSGVGFLDGKTIHESVVVPEGVRKCQLQNVVWSQGPESYRESVAKDDRYLAIARAKMLGFEKGASWRYVPLSLIASMRNALRAIHLITTSLALYVIHGYQQSLPLHQVRRHARYSFTLCGVRLIQAFRLCMILARVRKNSRRI